MRIPRPTFLRPRIITVGPEKLIRLQSEGKLDRIVKVIVKPLGSPPPFVLWRVKLKEGINEAGVR